MQNSNMSFREKLRNSSQGFRVNCGKFCGAPPGGQDSLAGQWLRQICEQGNTVAGQRTAYGRAPMGHNSAVSQMVNAIMPDHVAPHANDVGIIAYVPPEAKNPGQTSYTVQFSPAFQQMYDTHHAAMARGGTGNLQSLLEMLNSAQSQEELNQASQLIQHAMVSGQTGGDPYHDPAQGGGDQPGGAVVAAQTMNNQERVTRSQVFYAMMSKVPRCSGSSW